MLLDNVEYLILFYKNISKIDTCKSFFKNVLDDDFRKGNIDDWNIGELQNASYRDINSFLKAVDWDYIQFIVNRSWSDACDEFRMNHIELFM